jgi:tRNA pseudouridine55 synthase
MSPEPLIEGGLIVDKPSGPTSHDIVALARRALGESRIGHTGTLDPLATGVLVLLVGRATRLSQFLVTDEKEYLADVRLGVSTPTYDAASLGDPRCEGREARGEGRRARSASVEEVLSRFRGTYLQEPPPHSAKKIAGVPAYVKARRDLPVELQPVEVTVHELEIVAPGATTTPDETRSSPLAPRSSDTSLLRLRIVCSAGFYVRSLAHDLGQALGCGAHLEALRRIRAGRFSLDRAVPVELLATRPESARARAIQMNELLGHLGAVTVSDEGARRAAHGNTIAPHHVLSDDGASTGRGNTVRLLDASGAVLAVAERRPDALLHPLTVLV